MQTPHAKYPMP